MAQRQHGRSSEAGLTYFDRVIIVALLVGGGIWVVAHFSDPLWDYYVMKTLAKTVVTEYKDLTLHEVTKRVTYELDRNRIDNTDEKFTFGASEGGGYWADVETHIPLSINVADYIIAENKEWVLHYEVGK